MQPAAKYLYHVTWGLSAAIVTVHTIQDAWQGVQRYLHLACGYKQGPPGLDVMITPTEGTVCADYLYGTTTGRTARSIYTVPFAWSRIQGHLYMAATYRISSGMGRWG